MCGGSDSVKTFSSKSDMVKAWLAALPFAISVSCCGVPIFAQAGWVFSWDDNSLWDESATYSSAYRGSSASGDGMVSLQLQGHGTVVPSLGQ